MKRPYRPWSSTYIYRTGPIHGDAFMGCCISTELLLGPEDDWQQQTKQLHVQARIGSHPYPKYQQLQALHASMPHTHQASRQVTRCNYDEGLAWLLTIHKLRNQFFCSPEPLALRPDWNGSTQRTLYAANTPLA